jgi:hypothetical protein
MDMTFATNRKLSVQERHELELRRTARRLKALAKRAEAQGEVSAAINALRARADILRELNEHAQTSTGSSDLPTGVKAILTKLAWTGCVEDEERELLLNLEVIDGRDRVPPGAGIGAQERYDVVRKFFLSPEPEPPDDLVTKPKPN